MTASGHTNERSSRRGPVGGRASTCSLASHASFERSHASFALSVLLAGLVLLLVPACSQPPAFDREGAISNVLARGGGGMTPAQAECYVDRVHQELGADPLAPDTRPSAEVASRLAAIRVDCIGIGNLGTAPATTTTARQVSSGTSAPQRPGDDPNLDRLLDACRANGGVACDQLFDRAPMGSTYEELAGTCGGRTQELRCAEVYRDPVTPAGTSPSVPPVNPP